MTRPVRIIRAGCLATMLVIGCSSAKPDPAELSKEEQAILNVALAYREAASALQHGPASEQEIKPYLKQYGDPDKLLISPSDGQHYQFAWGVTPGRLTKSSMGRPYFVYEKIGKDGQRYAVDVTMRVHHLSESEFAKAQSPK
jgi:hypothetical protein